VKAVAADTLARRLKLIFKVASWWTGGHGRRGVKKREGVQVLAYLDYASLTCSGPDDKEQFGRREEKAIRKGEGEMMK